MRRTVTEWSPAEDLRPAAGAMKPIETQKGKVWRQRTYFEWDGLCSYTELLIFDDGRKITIDNGRIWPVSEGEGDPA